MRDAMTWMRDAMTPEEVRRRVLRMMRDARREEVSAFHELSAIEHAADAAALALAAAALDAVARVRALHVGRDLSDGLHHACRACELPFPCPTIRALDGEADR